VIQTHNNTGDNMKKFNDCTKCGYGFAEMKIFISDWTIERVNNELDANFDFDNTLKFSDVSDQIKRSQLDNPHRVWSQKYGKHVQQENLCDCCKAREEKRLAKYAAEEARMARGRKYQEDLKNPLLYKDVACRRCNGTGIVERFIHVNFGRCLGCGGKGTKKHKIRQR
jgi:hypothetical protein